MSKNREQVFAEWKRDEAAIAKELMYPYWIRERVMMAETEGEVLRAMMAGRREMSA